MKILKWIGVVVGILIALFVVVGLCLPSRYHVERSVVIDAPAEAIYPTISTPKTWPEWTAWTVEKYPDMKIAFSGPDSGKGAKYEWDAEAAGGHGELTLTYSDPAHGVKFDLNMNQGQFVATGGIGLEPG